MLKFLCTYHVTAAFLVKKHLVDTLHIGTLAIHPLLFYISLLFLIAKVLASYKKYSANILPLTLSSLSYLLTLTLLLGGFWGFQSTIWGYFWVNDTVEWLLLFSVLYTLWLIHTHSVSSNKLNYLLSLFMLVNFILLVRLNLLPTRHNFIQNSNLCFWVFSIFVVLTFTIYQVTFASTVSMLRVLVVLILFFINSNLTLSKCFTSVYISLFIFKTFPGFFTRKFYLHVCVFLFFFLWNIYFPYFYIGYEIYQNLITDFSVTAHYLNLINKHISVLVTNFKDLEGVVFSVFGDAERLFKLKFNLNCFVLLNNFYLLPVIILYFLL